MWRGVLVCCCRRVAMVTGGRQEAPHQLTQACYEVL